MLIAYSRKLSVFFILFPGDPVRSTSGWKKIAIFNSKDTGVIPVTRNNNQTTVFEQKPNSDSKKT